MKETIKNLILNSAIKKSIKEKILSKDFVISEPFKMTMEDFLDVYETRLEISESKQNGRGMGNIIPGLKELLENFRNSKAKSITIFNIYIDEEYDDIIFFTDSLFDTLFGYIE